MKLIIIMALCLAACGGGGASATSRHGESYTTSSPIHAILPTMATLGLSCPGDESFDGGYCQGDVTITQAVELGNGWSCAATGNGTLTVTIYCRPTPCTVLAQCPSDSCTPWVGCPAGEQYTCSESTQEYPLGVCR